MALKLLALGLLFLAAFAAAEVESDSEFATSDFSVEAAQKKANKSFDFFYFVQQVKALGFLSIHSLFFQTSVHFL